MRLFLAMAMLGAFLILSGCQVGDREVPVTLNQEKSLYRAGADNALTIYLDHMEDLERLEEHRWRAHEIAVDVRTLLDTGDVTDLSVGAFRLQLLSIVPDGFDLVAAQFLNIFSGANVDVDQIGPNNVKRLRAVATGLIESAMSYRMEDR